MSEFNFLSNYHNNLRIGAASASNLNYFSSDTESTQLGFQSSMRTTYTNFNSNDKESVKVDFN